ncbi:MAG: sugar transferase [Phascolarctobacterium sp.]|nr:sugar transferase [Phascolarctobacterium sp.]
MMLRKWEDLPKEMQNEAVRPYYESLKSKKISLMSKYLFDKVMSAVMLIGLAPIFLLLAVLIKMDSPGEVFFRQERVTQYGKKFRIHKFRTMVKNAEALGSQVTTKSDMRVTKIGKKLRGCRLDELPQLIDILQGNMSFVGTRPEVTKYVEQYTPEMYATLLLPAGVTSEASIEYKDEEKLLADAKNADKTYVEEVLPQKMQWNLQSLKNFDFVGDIKTMIKTVVAVM